MISGLWDYQIILATCNPHSATSRCSRCWAAPGSLEHAEACAQGQAGVITMPSESSTQQWSSSSPGLHLQAGLFWTQLGQFKGHQTHRVLPGMWGKSVTFWGQHTQPSAKKLLNIQKTAQLRVQDYLEQPSQEIGWNGAEPQQPRPKLWQGGKGGGRKGEAPRSRFAPVRTLFFRWWTHSADCLYRQERIP